MPLTYQGSTGALATSVTLPTHAVGDIIVIYSARGNAGAAPSIPSAGGTVPTWTNITSGGTNGHRLAYTVATATNHTSGTWTNAAVMMAVVLRGQGTSPIGGNALSFSATSSTNVTAPSITLSNSSGSSQIVHFLNAYTAATWNWNSAPSGYTSRLSVDNPGLTNGYRVLTKDSTTSDGSPTNTITVAATGLWGASVEILAAGSAGAFFAMF
jgi:hypothetical protein